MESHVLQYTVNLIPIDIVIKGLEENSYISYTEGNITKKYVAKGIEVNKLAQEANTNFGLIQRDSNGKIVTSSAGQIKNLLPFEYFADSTTDLNLMETIDKKMVNGLMKTYWGVFVFDSSGNYIEPVNFSLSKIAPTPPENPEADENTDGSIDINILCGYDYTDLQYAYKKNEGDYGDWVSLPGIIETIDSLGPGTYTVKVDSIDTILNEVLEKEIIL